MTTRRRMLTILAGAAMIPVLGTPAIARATNWRGIALGAEARIILDHPNADTLIPRAVAEIQRLENIFSLYLPDSQLSRLNQNGVLKNPAFELIELLSTCSILHSKTGGAFDPTIQTLWSLYARQHSLGSAPTKDQIATALADTGWRHITFSADAVAFDRKNMSLTLNGIAQGFIADKITDLFRENGVSNVLVNTGEISALGFATKGSPWLIKLDDNTGTKVPLTNAAIATSAPLGTAFDAEGKVGHIIDPRTGLPGGNWSQISVVSHSAAEADGLSTAFCLMNQPDIMAAKGRNTVYLR